MIETLAPAHLKPRLFHNSNGDLFIEIKVGGMTLSRALPPMETLEEAKDHINKVVPDMAKELYRRRRNRFKRERKL